MESVVTTKRDGKVLEITLNRPKVNAIDKATSLALYEAFHTLQEDADLLVGIITGTGRAFSAGWDLKTVAAAENQDDLDALESDESPGGFAGILEYWDLYKPVIGAINGFAIGGGFELALATDVMLAAEEAEFWLPEMERGFLASAGAIQRLPRRIPYNVCMELCWTGRHMGADEAKHWGLVSEVLPGDKLMDRSRELAQQISRGSPLATQALKAIMPVIMPLPVPEAMKKTQRGQSGNAMYERMMNSEDYFEGPRAFTEKRAPVWKGR